MSEIKVSIASIFTDRALMVRAEIDNDAVDEYAEAYRRGDKFPPLKVFKEGDKYLLVDGWHRYLAVKLAGIKTHVVTLFRGDRTKALEIAISSNTTHGLKRTNADKRVCIEKALAAWPKASNRAIAEKCGVDDKTVSETRSRCGSPAPEIVTGKDGKDYPAKLSTCGSSAPEDKEIPEKPHISQPTKPERPVLTVKKIESGKPLYTLAIWAEIEGLYGKALNRIDQLNQLCRNPVSHASLIAATKACMKGLDGWRESVKRG